MTEPVLPFSDPRDIEPWARIIPARWGFWIEVGSGLLVVCSGPGGSPKRWWRRTHDGARRKAAKLMANERRSHERAWAGERVTESEVRSDGR